jgi:hypothetical protein
MGPVYRHQSLIQAYDDKGARVGIGRAMTRKDELLKIAKVLRAQAEGRGPAKRYLRKLADNYQREAELTAERLRKTAQRKGLAQEA